MPFKKVLLILFIISSSLLGFAEVDENMVSAMKKYQSGEYLDSIYFLNSVLENNKELFSEALFWKSKSYYSLGDYKNSKKTLELFFREGSIVTAYYEDARFLYCKVFFKQGQYSDSLLLFNQYLRNNSFKYYRSSALFWIGEIYLQLSNLEKAKSSYTEFLQNSPESSVASKRLSLVNNMIRIMNKQNSEGTTIYDKAEWFIEYVIKEQKNGDDKKLSEFIDSFEKKEDFFKWLDNFTPENTKIEVEGTEKTAAESSDELEMLNDLETLLLQKLGDGYEK